MDNPATESGALDPNQAAAIFANMLDAEEPPKEEKKPEPEEPPVEVEEPEAEPEEETQESEDDPTVTIKIDGKDVEVKLSELKNGYQRQADYTRKTMEVSEQRKAAEAELSKAREERNQYAQGLQQTAALLQAQLQEQQNIDWQNLLENDPVEYLKQQHLSQERQARLQQTFAEQQKVAAIQQAEQQKAYRTFLQQQHDDLIAKLPEWKDETKAKADKAAMRDFLKNAGFSDDEIGNVADHRAVIMARKAMMYDQMIAKAKAAAKKVENLPTKTIKPTGGESAQVDKRGAAFQKLSKSGSIDDAAAVFASIL